MNKLQGLLAGEATTRKTLGKQAQLHNPTSLQDTLFQRFLTSVLLYALLMSSSVFLVTGAVCFAGSIVWNTAGTAGWI